VQTSTSGTTALTHSTSYEYDKNGNRWKKVDVVGGVTTTITNQYNANDQLLKEVTRAGSTLTATNDYVYDANGSLTARTNITSGGTATALYTYDLKNKLSTVKVVGEPGITSYLYNEQGIRVRSQKGANMTHYLVDANNHTGYAQVLEELNTIGSTPSRSYVLGDDVLAQCGTTAGDRRWLLYDGHGSTRQLVDADWEVTSRYNYDAYGLTLGTSSTTADNAPTSLLYCGEQYDPTLKMYNLRARYYNPENGRFNSRDPFKGINSDPQSLHKYNYAHQDPVNGIDPSGLLTLGEQILVWSTIAFLAANLAVVSYKAIKYEKDLKGPPTAIAFGVQGQAFALALGGTGALECVHVFSTGETKSPYVTGGYSAGFYAGRGFGVILSFIWNMQTADEYLGATSALDFSVSAPNGLTGGVGFFASIGGDYVGTRFFFGYGRNVSGIGVLSFVSVSATASWTWRLPNPVESLEEWVRETLVPALRRPTSQRDAVSSEAISSYATTLAETLPSLPQNLEENLEQ